jgi:hypothetical protein
MTLTRVAVVAACIFAAQVAYAADPANLTATVNGSTVSLAWTGDDPQWILEAGSAPGLSNLARFALPTSNPAYVVTGVPPGTYYVRVRGVRNGVVGPASNEIVLSVSTGSTGCPPPLGRVDLRTTVSGSQVAFDWNFSGPMPTSWQFQAGSGPGLADLLVINLPREQTQLLATAPPGTYYVRVRRLSACDVTSNETIVQTFAGAQACVPTLPANGIVAMPGQVVSVALQLPAGCQWVAEPQEAWITLLTTQGTAADSLRFTVSNQMGGSGQIPITTTSGRYLLQVFHQ